MVVIPLLVDAGRSRVGYDDLTHACPKSILIAEVNVLLVNSFPFCYLTDLDFYSPSFVIFFGVTCVWVTRHA